MAEDDLLLLFNQRDEHALRETLRRYGALCRQIAQRILGSAEDAEECVNDALLKAWNAIPPEQPENFRAYISALTRNTALNRFRDERTAKRGGGELPAALEELGDIFDAQENVEQQVDRRALMEAVRRFLDALPQEQRQLFLRRYLQMVPVSALAEECGEPEGTVRVRLMRIRRRLAAFLEKEGWT